MKRYLLKYNSLFLQYDQMAGYFLAKKGEITQFETKNEINLLLSTTPIYIENYDFELNKEDFEIVEFEINEII